MTEKARPPLTVQAYPLQERWTRLASFLSLPEETLLQVREAYGGLAALKELEACPFLGKEELRRLQEFAHLAALFCAPENLPWGWEELLRHLTAQMGTEERIYVIPIAGGSFLPPRLLNVGDAEEVAFSLGRAFAHALRVGAGAVVVAHSHPHGPLTPSPEDLQVTEALVQAGRLLDVAVVDHLILTPAGWYSIARSGKVPGLALPHQEGESPFLLPDLVTPGEEVLYAADWGEEVEPF